MTTCPKCGSLVREGQKFCGVCGAEVKRAPAATPAPASPPPSSSPPTPGRARPAPNEEPPISSDYPQEAPDYEYQDEMEETPRPGRLILVAGVLVVAVCCALALGILVGLEASCYLPGNTCGTPVPTLPKVTPTTTGMNLLPFILSWLA